MMAFLQRDLSRRDAFAIVVGCIIGAGIFRAPASVAGQIADPFLILAVWAAGGLFSLAGALTYAELSTLYPKTGGDYVYIKETYGPLTGFLFGWTKLFIERTGTIAILAFVFAEYLGYVFGYPREFCKYVALGAIAFLTFANILGLKYGKDIQNLFTFLKVAAIVSIIGLGLAFLPHEMRTNGVVLFRNSHTAFSPSLISAAGVGLIYVFWTYSGWGEAVYVAEEIREPEKNVPWAVIGGLGFVTALYLLINFVYLLYLTPPEIKTSGLVAALMMERIVGPWAGKIVSCFVAVSAFGALNGFILTGGRILYALAADHALFSRLARVHPKFHTPVGALLVNGLIAGVLVWTKTLDQLMEYTTVAISVFYALSGFSVILLRKRFPDRLRKYRVWGYPWVPLAFVASMGLFVVNAAFQKPKESFWGLGLVAFGVFLYYISGRMRRETDDLKTAVETEMPEEKTEAAHKGERQ